MNKKLRAKIILEFGTQADFAAAMKLDESIVSRVVRGRRSLKPEDAEKWSRVLDCDKSLLEEQR
jgi:plasmid maintenance system antidote protein VapI